MGSDDKGGRFLKSLPQRFGASLGVPDLLIRIAGALHVQMR